MTGNALIEASSGNIGIYARHSRLGKIWRECGSEFWVILEILSGRRSCSPESSCCDLDIPPTTGSEAVRRVGILMGGPGSGRPKSRHRTVEPAWRKPQ